MKKLSDKQFDDLLRQKAESFNYDFDELAWEKMEQKLRRRDRVVFIRNSSFILLVLLFTGGAFFLLNNSSVNEKNKIAKEIKPIKQNADSITSTVSGDKTALSQQGKTATKIDGQELLKGRNELSDIKEINVGNILSIKSSAKKDPNKTTATSIQAPDFLDYTTASSITQAESIIMPELPTDLQGNKELRDDTSALNKTEIKSLKKKKAFAFSITALAGPEFSSIESIAGNKGKITVGLLLNTSISNKISVSSGIKYGMKEYQASSYNYELQNPARASQISGIDASCNILEIPLQVSYSLLDNSKKKIAISTGLSSYLMLKEEYNFRYTPQSGRKDYLLVKNNSNQHYLSVLSLSASYHFKPKSSKMQWSIEPFVKLPLGGVGEGNVKLKSSGVSLNLTYDISKKNK